MLQEEQPVAVKSLIVNPPMFFGYDVLYVGWFVLVSEREKKYINGVWKRGAFFVLDINDPIHGVAESAS